VTDFMSGCVGKEREGKERKGEGCREGKFVQENMIAIQCVRTRAPNAADKSETNKFTEEEEDKQRNKKTIQKTKRQERRTGTREGGS
jgi:hypothetical protein